MTVEEKIVNNKIVESCVPYVLELVRNYMKSLSGNRVHREYYLKIIKGNSAHKDEFDLNDFIKIQLNIKDLIDSHEKLFIQDAVDLYEFFYLEWKPGDSGYNYNNFPLDEKDFKKKRFSKKQIEKLIKNPIDNIDEIVKIMKKNEKLLRSYFKKESQEIRKEKNNK